MAPPAKPNIGPSLKIRAALVILLPRKKWQGQARKIPQPRRVE